MRGGGKVRRRRTGGIEDRRLRGRRSERGRRSQGELRRYGRQDNERPEPPQQPNGAPENREARHRPSKASAQEFGGDPRGRGLHHDAVQAVHAFSSAPRDLRPGGRERMPCDYLRKVAVQTWRRTEDRGGDSDRWGEWTVRSGTGTATRSTGRRGRTFASISVRTGSRKSGTSEGADSTVQHVPTGQTSGQGTSGDTSDRGDCDAASRPSGGCSGCIASWLTAP